jgi:hypothetical protein
MRTLAAAAVLAAATLGIAASAFANAPTTQTLTPPPPSFYNCKAVGAGTICEGTRVDSHVLEPSGNFCGSGADRFELLDTATNVIHVFRYYDTDGNLTKRVVHEDYTTAETVNSVTGASLPYT